MTATVANYCLLALGAAMAAGGWFWRKSVMIRFRADPSAKNKKARTWSTVLLAAGLWDFLVELLRLLFGEKKSEKFTVSIWAPRVQVGAVSLSTTVLVTWAVMGVLLILAVLFRLLVVPRMTDKPRGVQNVVELAVESVQKYTKTTAGDQGDVLPCYLFSIAAFMLGCAASELFGLRAPTSDITMTFSLALITFVMVNYYGIRRKGVKGRLKSMAQPTPVVFPIKVVSDLAVPVSLACRLFGNMLGGMIVMDLLYFALRNAAVGFPSVLGLYFNVFHPLIQIYIFITLTLTYINEAAE